jgi:hypothetical protein
MLDLNKPYRLRNGDEVVIISNKARGVYPLAGHINQSDNIVQWTEEGCFYPHGKESPFDIVNIPEEKFLYLNIYKDGTTDSCASKTLADYYSWPGRIACVRVPYKVGQIDE